MWQVLTSKRLVTTLLIPLLGMAGSQVLRAQESQRMLLAAYVPPQLLSAPADESTNSTWALAAPDLGGLAVTAQHPRAEQRWEKFDAEFGIRQRSPSLFKGTLQQAKYNLDQTVFELDNFVNHLENALTFEYRLSGSHGSPHAARAYFSPLNDLWDNTRLKSEVNLDMLRGRAFVGITLQFPFGD